MGLGVVYILFGGCTSRLQQIQYLCGDVAVFGCIWQQKMAYFPSCTTYILFKVGNPAKSC